MRFDPSLRRSTAVRSAVGALVGAALLAAGCGSDTPSSESTSSDSDASAAALDVVASFYPLQFVAEQVGGTTVAVTNITPAGAEPHDLELTARDTAALQDSDLIVYLAGFATAVDDGIDIVGTPALDVAPAADMDLAGAAHEGEHTDEQAGIDPHFWLDPLRLADVGDAVAERLTELSPENTDTYAANAAALRTQLEQLDAEFQAGLDDCASTDLVTSHEAFGYLAQRYGLTQVGITGLSPDEEPSPARLAEVTDLVRANDVRTIYFETLVDPSIAETVASETGASTAVLDPLEGLTDDSAGGDYLAVMRANLEILRSGQGCS